MGIINIDFNEKLEEQNDDDQNGHGNARQGPSKRKVEMREIYISPEREAKIRSEYSQIAVHDFGDDYHLTDEERREKNQYYELFHIVEKATNKIKKITDYIQVVRNYLKCLDAVAENNGVYEPEKFKKLFFKKKIIISGMKSFPEYKGKDKKELNWEFISDFILSDQDISEFPLNKPEKKVYSKSDYEDMAKLLFEPENLHKILTGEDDKENVVEVTSRKQSKQRMRIMPEILIEMRNIRHEARKNRQFGQICDFNQDDFEAISRYDQKHNFVMGYGGRIPKFKGEILSDKDYDKFMSQMEEYEETQFRESYNGKLRTKEEIRELEMKELLEEEGWNIRNLYDNKHIEKRMRKAMKADNEREKRLKAKLARVQSRRTLDDIEKGRNVKKKKIKKKEKEKKKFKKEASEATERLFMDNINGASSFDEYQDYKEEMKDWSWENIMNQDLD